MSGVNDPFMNHSQMDVQQDDGQQYGSIEQQDAQAYSSTKNRRFKLGGVFIMAGLPFTVFLVVFWTYVFVYANPVPCALLATAALVCAIFCIVMDFRNRRKWWFYVGALSFVAVFFGLFTGALVWNGLMRKYASMAQQSYYSNVLPSEYADAHRDAGVIQFASSAVVDISKSVGFKDKRLYCVAPIMTSSMASRVEYFAVGIDCCQSRASFSCDDAASVSAREGIVVNKHTFMGDAIEANYDLFEEAVSMSEAVYGFTSSDNPIFVHWVNNAEEFEASLYSQTVIASTFTLIGYFALSVVAGMFFHNVWKRSLE